MDYRFTPIAVWHFMAYQPLKLLSSYNGVLFFLFQNMRVLQASSMGWNGPPAITGTPVVKKVVRLDVPVDKYPNVRLDFLMFLMLSLSFLAMPDHEWFALFS